MNKRKIKTIVFEGVEIYDGWEQDGRALGYNTKKQIVGATGGLTGAAIGAKYVAGDFGLLSKPANKYLSIGKTAINVIDNVGNGKYIDAAGNVIMSFVDCSIGVYIDIGVAIYKTNLMQRRIAHSATKEYFNLQNRLNNLVYGSSEYNRVRDKMEIQENIIKQCADNLGIKYNTSIQPQ